MEETRILLVDDEPNILKGLALHLRRLYRVWSASSGSEALGLLGTQGPFAVIVSDMRMPGMDGATLLSTVCKQAPDTIRMLLTGHADLDSAVLAVNEGQIFRFLTKPCTPDHFRNAVSSWETSGHSGSTLR